jgi:formylglycine-generating enzyme required for sulfatase activity
MLRRIAAIPLLLALSLTAQPQDRRVTPQPARRVALVIGNNSYPWKPLKNPINDARAIAAKLKQMGFSDVALLTDATRDQMALASARFVDAIRPGDLAYLYYSGHGVEVKGQNYLLPVNFPANATETEASYQALSAQKLLKDLEQASAQVRVVVIDACRDNPLSAAKSGAGGLVRMEAEGTLILFATAANHTADDNVAESNGLFTKHLLAAMDRPGISLSQMAKQVQLAVSGQSAKRQIPAIYDNLLEDFPLTPAPTAPAVKADSELWAMIRNSNNPQDFDEFATTFPNSELASAAKLRAANLRRAAPGPSTTPTPPADTHEPKVNRKDGLTYVWIRPGGGNNGFWLGRTDVTQAAYEKVTSKNPSHFKGPQLPVETVSWNEADSYCRAIGGRLPTEKEWEYAARAGTAGETYGNLDDIAWYNNNSGNTTHPVGQKKPNAFGLYDMLGNVFQWMDDWYDSKKEYKSLRGGSWYFIPEYVRVSGRDRSGPDGRNSLLGFRCVGD